MIRIDALSSAILFQFNGVSKVNYVILERVNTRVMSSKGLVIFKYQVILSVQNRPSNYSTRINASHPYPGLPKQCLWREFSAKMKSQAGNS
jgi:hypothetical protein